MSFQSGILITILVLLLVFILACGTSQVIASLETAVSAAEAAIPIIASATGLPPATTAMIVTYLQAVSTATGQASVILAGTGTTAEKSAQIISDFAQVALGLKLPSGTPSQVISIIESVAQAVGAFLSNFKGQASVTVPKLKPVDSQKLASLKNRSDANLTKLKGVKR